MKRGDGLPDFATNKVLRWVVGAARCSRKTYVMNPLHPEVAPLYRNSWRRCCGSSETNWMRWSGRRPFMSAAATWAPESYRGYADRAMMRLTRDLSLWSRSTIAGIIVTSLCSRPMPSARR